MKILQHILVFLIVGLFVLACKTNKNVVSTKPTNYPKVKNYGIGKLIDSITTNYISYDTLSVKFKLKVDLSDESHNIDGVFRIKKDSLIWISLMAPLGIEAARVMFTQDSIYFMNKLKKEYFIKPYSLFENNYHVELTFNDIQAILSNQLFLFSETDEDSNLEMNPNSNEREYIKKTFFRDKDSINYILKTHRKHKIKRSIRRNTKDMIVENIKIIPQTFKINHIEIVDYIENRKLDIEYQQFENINSKLFPKSLQFVIQDSLKTFQVQLEFSKVTINGESNLSFNIPNSYKRLP
ncbi:MAG TPA: DUF4292 domain-containing protein [Bacteroidales bacterium]|nr:DUF4292 domain-containing protein [Bacteroidales bacterium]